MKISLIVMITVCLSTLTLLAHNSDAQTLKEVKISIDAKNEPLTSVLNRIEKLTTFHFVYPSSHVKAQLVKKLSVKERPVEQVLKELLLPNNLTFKQLGDNILINRLPEPKPVEKAAPVNISGKIIDDKGLPLPGVTISVKEDNSKATIADAEGRYRITTDANNTLVFYFVGFERLEKAINGQTTLNITLLPSTNQLKDVVVVGYGTQNKKDLTTSVASLNAGQINNFPSTGLDKALTGKLAGVQVLQPAGAPGAGIAIAIRGRGSVTSGSDPLYVIDGVPLSDNDVNGPGFKVNPLNAINVNDIESIDVLKDASAAAIYGSRGSNGVVIITTKKGTKEKPVISLNSYYGIQSVTKKLPRLDAYGYADLIYNAHNNTYFDFLASKGLTGNATDDNATRLSKLGAAATNTSLAYLIPPEIFPYLNKQPGLTNIDWQDQIFRKAPMQSHTFSVGGGGDKMNYYISGNYLNQDGVVINSGYKKYTGRVNLDAHYNHLRLGTRINYAYGIYDYLPTEGRFNDNSENIISAALVASPFFPVYNSDGSYNYDQYKWQYSQPGVLNPVALAQSKVDRTYEKKLLANVFAEYEILKDLKYKISFGTDISDYNRSTYRPSTLPNPVTRLTPSTPVGSYITSGITNWLAENTLSYSKTFGNNNIKALLGYTAQKERSTSSNISATGYPTDIVQTLNGATTITGFTSAIQEWSLLSALSRVQYSYKGRYLLSGAIRRDGSSRFGASNKYGYFPSASAGWIISDEDFMKSSKVISSFKLRASYGVTGNFQIGNYSYLAAYSPANYVFGPVGSTGLATGLYQSTASNPNLGWEKTAAVNIGTDIGLFNDAITATIDIYNNNTTNLLLNVPVPQSTGYSTNLINVGKVNNKGFEVTLSSSNQIGKLKISNSANISKNINKVIDLGGVNSIITQAENTIYFITQVGKPIGNYFTLVTDGVFKDQADIDATKAKVPGAKPGDFKYKDINGDNIIDGNDKTITGNYMPEFTYGFSTQLQYGAIDLGVAAQGLYGNKVANIGQRHYSSVEGYGNSSPDIYNNRYISPAQPGNGNVPRANRSQTGLNAQISTYHLSDGSYLRIRDITLGVTLPQQMVKKAGISSLRLYVTGQNLFTFTKYNGYNPEVSNDTGNNPISANNSPLTPGVDYGSYPLSKTFLLGINLKF
ncbi:SusC/RagA family TonB-linked outer membrane protein [Mucilaginibacter phyllosphaerae]|uniref:TonB-linked SusC/RagA family outer membrane protein n=2 Tax=Mucilaginibacter phyllosphaerae TaxID=1812349 RepID=A0ABR6I3C5_9SPHI|nr:TonB-dependent receptor [Mucilaginibacter phyllosphaerae]MBB3967540.1 TonB-linked SusC/RagA family outer membrane protein [Mucilaginibacter phyllosphaerae]